MDFYLEIHGLFCFMDNLTKEGEDTLIREFGVSGCHLNRDSDGECVMAEFLNMRNNIETWILIIATILPLIGSYYIVKIDWKRYGLLFLAAGIIGNILCYTFVAMGFYSFPYRILPGLSPMPITAILTAFPYYVLLGVRYSPKPWVWKLPFYWAFVHVGVLLETYAVEATQLIEYNYQWDFWNTYTWWWIYLLGFEWVAGTFIPDRLRKPLDFTVLNYAKTGWFVLHFIFILTVFLGGYYLGRIAP